MKSKYNALMDCEKRKTLGLKSADNALCVMRLLSPPFMPAPGQNDFLVDKFPGFVMLAHKKIEGDHVPTRAGAIDICNQLKKMHDNDWVHGDIKTGNCLFTESSGCLIDFDYTNHPGTPYTSVVIRDLPERHPDIRSGAAHLLDKQHDIYSLAHVLGMRHPELHTDIDSIIQEIPRCL